MKNLSTTVAFLGVSVGVFATCWWLAEEHITRLEAILDDTIANDPRVELASRRLAEVWGEAQRQLQDTVGNDPRITGVSQRIGKYSNHIWALAALHAPVRLARLTSITTIIASITAGRTFVGLFVALLFLSITGRWAFWLLFSLVIGFVRWLATLYQLFRILIDMVLFFFVSLVGWVQHSWRVVSCWDMLKIRSSLHSATCYKDWCKAAAAVDKQDGVEAWKAEEAEQPIFDQRLLVETTAKLRGSLSRGEAQELLFMLSALIKRNSMGIDHPRLHSRALLGTKHCIEAYMDVVCDCMSFLASPKAAAVPLETRLEFFHKAKDCLGCTALGLSGGGSLGMYHMGVCRALLLQGCLPDVITGASGGSIVAGLIACHTDQELLDEIFVKDVSTRYLAEGIRWFPPLHLQLVHFLKKGMLIEGDDFQRTTDKYYGSWTFQDAYNKTGRHVNISVSACSTTSSGGSYKLILNHISTPHVLLASAVRASCALPGIMKSATLLCANELGQVVPYLLADNMRWVDGSIQSDIPRDRIASLFNVTNVIVSQVNPHIVPFINKTSPGSCASSEGWLSHLETLLSDDFRNRCIILGTFGVIPRLFGQDINKVFSQRYLGNVNIVPALTMSDTLKAILNPTEHDMERYIAEGQRCCWPKVAHVQFLMRGERAVKQCLVRVRAAAAAAASFSGSPRLRASLAPPASAPGYAAGRRKSEGPGDAARHHSPSPSHSHSHSHSDSPSPSHSRSRSHSHSHSPSNSHSHSHSHSHNYGRGAPLLHAMVHSPAPPALESLGPLQRDDLLRLLLARARHCQSCSAESKEAVARGGEHHERHDHRDHHSRDPRAVAGASDDPLRSFLGLARPPVG